MCKNEGWGDVGRSIHGELEGISKVMGEIETICDCGVRTSRPNLNVGVHACTAVQ